jgi:hypothetical protein
MPRDKLDQVDEDPTGAGILHEKGLFMGAPHKTQLLAHFHVGDLITSIHKVSMVAGGREVLLYTGLHGTIGVLVPLASKEDVDFISTLEQHIRTEQTSLIGQRPLGVARVLRPRQDGGRRGLVRDVRNAAASQAECNSGRAGPVRRRSFEKAGAAARDG